MTKMSSKNRVRVAQIMAQLKLALIEETPRAQHECVKQAQFTLNTMEFELLNGITGEKPAEKPVAK